MSGNIPYIGSKISLITTSDIRYEGILYTLNREESTIAVQNVRSFGTEGRRCPEVPMSNEIYDFIIFRGKDLKDLTVLQGAPEPPAPPYSVGGGSDFVDSSGMPNYGQSLPPVEQPPRVSQGVSVAPSMGSTATGRNGFPPSSQPPMPNTYTGGYQNPTSSASRPAPGAYGGGMPVRQAYPSQEMPQALVEPPTRVPLYEESNGAQRMSSHEAAKDALARGAQSKGAGLNQALGKGAAGLGEDLGGDKSRGRGKGGSQKKSLYEVLRFHKRAEELIVKMMRGQSSANIGPGELRAMSEMNPSVYHFYLDFVNYCCPSHTVQSDEQQWEMLCKALKKHFEKEFGANQAPQKPVQPQRPNNTLGDFITITHTSEKAGSKKKPIPAPRGGGPRPGRGAGRGDKGPTLGGEWDGLDLDESPQGASSGGGGGPWSCPRCTLRNESLLLECAACGTSKQQAALWAEFPPLG